MSAWRTTSFSLSGVREVVEDDRRKSTRSTERTGEIEKTLQIPKDAPEIIKIDSRSRRGNGSSTKAQARSRPVVGSVLDASSRARGEGIHHDHEDKERVKVFVRVRPTNIVAEETPGALRFRPDKKSIGIVAREDRTRLAEYTFDGVLGQDATQADVYSTAAKDAVSDVLHGFNATVLAYGQTGAGKTHTLGCAPKADSIGIIPRAMSEIFDVVGNDALSEYEISLSYLQVYCEQIQDLLCPENGENLAIREDTTGSVHVPGLTAARVTSLQDCLHLMQMGNRNRKVAFTSLNATSSRSHAVLMLTVVKRSASNTTVGASSCAPAAPNRVPNGDRTSSSNKKSGNDADVQARRVRIGRLYLVDLAGSERLKKSGSTGLRASEAKHINLSLTTLGKCINARAIGGNVHVPFRDSKLTRLLQDSLGGNARTSLVIAITDAQEHAEESSQSLNFGHRAMRVTTSAKINECIEYPDGFGGFQASSKAHYGSSADMKNLALERSLLQRESELEAVQEALRNEQLQSQLTVEALQREKQAVEASHRLAVEEYERHLQASRNIIDKLQRQHSEDKTALEEEKSYMVIRKDEEIAAAVARAQEAFVSEVEWKERYQAAQTDVLNLQQDYKEKLDAMRSEYATRESVLMAERDAHARRAAELSELYATAQQSLQASEEKHAKEMETITKESYRELKTIQSRFQQLESTLRDEISRKEKDIAVLEDALASKTDAVMRSGKAIAALNIKLSHAEDRIEEITAQHKEAKQRFDVAEQRALEAETSRSRLVDNIMRKRRIHRAAAVIQRAWRKHSVAQMKRLRDDDYAALHEARDALGNLASQHAELEERRHDNLAFTGQSLIGESLEVLQDAVEGLVAYFLLPSRDFKAVSRYKSLRNVRSGNRSRGVLETSYDIAPHRSSRYSMSVTRSDRCIDSSDASNHNTFGDHSSLSSSRNLQHGSRSSMTTLHKMASSSSLSQPQRGFTTAEALRCHSMHASAHRNERPSLQSKHIDELETEPYKAREHRSEGQRLVEDLEAQRPELISAVRRSARYD